MLVLTRKLGEQIIIDGAIRVTVVAIQGRQVRIGIEAPGDVPIFRSELLEANTAAALGATVAVGAERS